jgi:hypothetical protein
MTKRLVQELYFKRAALDFFDGKTVFAFFGRHPIS